MKIDLEKAHQYEQDAQRHELEEEHLRDSLELAEDHPLRARARRRARTARQLAAIWRTGQRPGVVDDIVEVNAELTAAGRVADQWRAERTHPVRAAALRDLAPLLVEALEALCVVSADERVGETVYGIRPHRPMTEKDVELARQAALAEPPPTRERAAELFDVPVEMLRDP